MSVEKPRAPWRNASASAALQRGQRRAVRRGEVGLSPEYIAAQRGVTGDEPGVERDAAFERVEIFAEALPCPRHALFEGLQWHAFDLGHQAPCVVGVDVVQRRERKRTVAADHRRDAVEVRRCREGIPEELRVVVRVRIDEAGAHDESVGIDRVTGGFGDLAHRHDAAVTQRDVADEAGLARAIDDRGALDQMVEHRTPPELSAPTLRIAPHGLSAVAAVAVEYPSAASPSGSTSGNRAIRGYRWIATSSCRPTGTPG